MMTPAAPRSRGFHVLAAIVGTGAFLVLVNLLPTLATANDSQLVIKCAAVILFAAHFLTDSAGLLRAIGHRR